MAANGNISFASKPYVNLALVGTSRWLWILAKEIISVASKIVPNPINRESPRKSSGLIWPETLKHLRHYLDLNMFGKWLLMERFDGR